MSLSAEFLRLLNHLSPGAKKAGLGNLINGLQTAVSAIQGDVSAIQDDVSALQDDVAALEAGGGSAGPADVTYRSYTTASPGATEYAIVTSGESRIAKNDLTLTIGNSTPNITLNYAAEVVPHKDAFLPGQIWRVVVDATGLSDSGAPTITVTDLNGATIMPAFTIADASMSVLSFAVIADAQSADGKRIVLIGRTTMT